LLLDINDPEQRGDLLEVCFRLFNLHTWRIGINQIRSVYLPIWFENNNEESIWQDFGDMLFSEQRKNDCVARFHTYGGLYSNSAGLITEFDIPAESTWNITRIHVF
jgi:hypothetical protein